MAISVRSDIEEFEEIQSLVEPSLFPSTAMDLGDNLQKERLRLDVSISTRDVFLQRNRMLELHDGFDKIKAVGFSFSYPWLPQKALELLRKSKKGLLTQKELIMLMKLVSDRATVHFQLDEGKYVAMTFYGRVVEVSDTRVDLLKKIQGLKLKEQVFLWRIGFSAFSGRL